MADASCGPSNAFKGLARHIEQDRSHQQDRVVPGSQRPAQTFRSTPLNSGFNSQFGAFQQQNAVLPEEPVANGQRLLHLGDLPSHPAQAAPLFQPQPMQQQPVFAQSARSDWINDFQRMNFSDAHARPLHSQPVQGQDLRWMSPVNPMYSNLPSPASQFYHPHSTNFNQMPPAFGPVHPVQAGNNVHISQSMGDASLASNTQLDAQLEAQLAQEFENAMDDWMVQNGPEDDLNASLDAASAEPEVQEETKEESEGNEEQDTELARAAQQLVDLLADNDSDKFKNSNFISLMRRIASRQLTVQGNDLVETSPSPPGTDTETASAAP